MERHDPSHRQPRQWKLLRPPARSATRRVHSRVKRCRLAGWACARCGQTWTGERLETVAAYIRFADSLNHPVQVGPLVAETIH